jgi:hypothetical protein
MMRLIEGFFRFWCGPRRPYYPDYHWLGATPWDD